MFYIFETLYKAMNGKLKLLTMRISVLLTMPYFLPNRQTWYDDRLAFAKKLDPQITG